MLYKYITTLILVLFTCNQIYASAYGSIVIRDSSGSYFTFVEADSSLRVSTVDTFDVTVLNDTIDVRARITNDTLIVKNNPDNSVSRYVSIFDTSGNKSWDAATAAINIIDYSHHEIHSGRHYFTENFFDVPSSDILDIRFIVTDTTRWVHMLIILRSQEEYRTSLFEGVTITTAGTALDIYNSNRNSSNVSIIDSLSFIVNTNLANAQADTDTSSAIRLRNTMIGSNQGNIEGENRADNEIILKQNTKYCIRCENMINSVRYIAWLLDWYEHIDKN